MAVEGLTSAANRGFVAGAGLYDRVASYDALFLLAADRTRLIVDMAGSAVVNRALHGRFGDRLVGNIRVGAANWAESTPARDLPGPKPRVFFAPDAWRAAREALGIGPPDGPDECRARGGAADGDGARPAAPVGGRRGGAVRLARSGRRPGTARCGADRRGTGRRRTASRVKFPLFAQKPEG